jgi:hypothetical protein
MRAWKASTGHGQKRVASSGIAISAMPHDPPGRPAGGDREDDERDERAEIDHADIARVLAAPLRYGSRDAKSSSPGLFESNARSTGRADAIG